MNDDMEYTEVVIPPETELLFSYFRTVQQQLQGHGSKFTIDELYEDMELRAYLMLRVLDELGFTTMHPA